MDVTSVLLAPVRVPFRVAQALDDLNTLAERARRDPEPVEEVRKRIDTLIVELGAVIAVAREIVEGGRELTETAKAVNASARALDDVAISLDATGRDIVDGGQELTATSKTLHVDTRDLIDGGERLTAVTENVERHMRVFRSALPRLLEGLDTVEELEEAVETVADTVEPLQA